MATLKHIASKNADYGRSIEYLVFEHDERGRPLHDRNGSRVMRDRFLLEGINCDPFSYDEECRMLNRQYHKNREPEDIKSHHYIISFDPKDKAEGLLTPERAQELGMEFAARCFPGHQILVCTHNDGHNESGNIHVHIIFNSLRKLDVERQPFTEREIDSRAGYKHHPTDEFIGYIKQELMKMCEREGLHQVDLIKPAREKVTDKEYRVNQRGQKKLDDINEKITAAGMTPAATKFQTQKQFLRDAVRDCASQATTYEEFKKLLAEKYGIELKDRRGRFSYLHPDRRKYITDRALGSDYEKEHVLAMIQEKVPDKTKEARMDTGQEEQGGAEHRNIEAGREAGESRKYPPEYDPSYDYHADPVAILYIHSHLRIVTDLQTCIKAQQNAAYARKVKVTNLKEMARTVVFLQENGFDTHDDLIRKKTETEEKAAALTASLSKANEDARTVNAQIHFAGQYYANKAVHADFLKSRMKRRFREVHGKELDLYEEAVRFFEENYDGSIPSLKNLMLQKEQLAQEREALSDELKTRKDQVRVLQTAVSNIDVILGKEPEIKAGRKRSEPEL